MDSGSMLEVEKQREECNETQEPSSKKPRTLAVDAKMTSSESLAENAQSIIDEIDMKRKNDETLIAEFRKMMEVQVETWCGTLQQSFGKLYERSNGACQDKLQKLYEVLGRINQLEQEMFAFKESLKMLYSEVEHE